MAVPIAPPVRLASVIRSKAKAVTASAAVVSQTIARIRSNRILTESASAEMRSAGAPMRSSVATRSIEARRLCSA